MLKSLFFNLFLFILGLFFILSPKLTIAAGPPDITFDPARLTGTVTNIEVANPPNCIVLYIQNKENQYIHSSEATLGNSCAPSGYPAYSDSNAFLFTLIPVASMNFSIGRLSANDYKIWAQAFKMNCNIDTGSLPVVGGIHVGCAWERNGITKQINFTVETSTPTPPGGGGFDASISPNSGKGDQRFTITASLKDPSGNPIPNNNIDVIVRGGKVANGATDATGKAIIPFSLASLTLKQGNYQVIVRTTVGGNLLEKVLDFTITQDYTPKGNVPVGLDQTGAVYGGGISCGSDAKPGFITAIGCIHTNPVDFVQDFIKFTVAVSGGLAFLMMLLGAFQMITSAGNPDSLHAGRDRLTSAVVGLLFVIFAVLLLQIIGVSILCIPGFGTCT